MTCKAVGNTDSRVTASSNTYHSEVATTLDGADYFFPVFYAFRWDISRRVVRALGQGFLTRAHGVTFTVDNKLAVAVSKGTSYFPHSTGRRSELFTAFGPVGGL